MAKKLYECTISFTYEAEEPVDAANQFIANVHVTPDWYVLVKDTETGEQCTVDTELGLICD